MDLLFGSARGSGSLLGPSAVWTSSLGTKAWPTKYPMVNAILVRQRPVPHGARDSGQIRSVPEHFYVRHLVGNTEAAFKRTLSCSQRTLSCSQISKGALLGYQGCCTKLSQKVQLECQDGIRRQEYYHIWCLVPKSTMAL